jgi:type IV secretion system protein VirD4
VKRLKAIGWAIVIVGGLLIITHPRPSVVIGALVGLAAFAGLAVLAGWAVVPQRRLAANRVRYQRVRLWLRLHPGKGQAALWTLWWRWGRLASFRQSDRVRPTLTWRERLNPREHSIYLGRAQYGRKIRVGLQENILILAPPRVGKSGFLAQAVLHAPGPVVSGSTRDDIFKLTSGVRSKRGTISVFNPQQIGNVPSTIRWNPLDGCDVPATAIRRADALVYATAGEQNGGDDQAWWTSKASSAMRSLLIAGALIGTPFATVAQWIMGGDFSVAISILKEAGHAQFAANLNELMGPAERTSATIRMFMSRCVAFMSDPLLAQAVAPVNGDQLDIDEFVSGPNTLYLIGEAQGVEAPLAPLHAALTSEIQFRAVQLGSQRPGGRLDPPMLLAIDEATQTTPVPLPNWLADGAGKGVPVMTVAHGVSQLRRTYGEHGARAILDTSGVWILLGGISDPDTLAMAEKLSGEIAIHEHGADSKARHPVLSGEMVRELPPGFSVILRGALAPVVVRLPMCWKDRTYRRAKRRGQDVADLSCPAPIWQAHEAITPGPELGEAL